MFPHLLAWAGLASAAVVRSREGANSQQPGPFFPALVYAGETNLSTLTALQPVSPSLCSPRSKATSPNSPEEHSRKPESRDAPPAFGPSPRKEQGPCGKDAISHAGSHHCSSVLFAVQLLRRFFRFCCHLSRAAEDVIWAGAHR